MFLNFSAFERAVIVTRSFTWLQRCRGTYFLFLTWMLRDENNVRKKTQMKSVFKKWNKLFLKLFQIIIRILLEMRRKLN